MPLLSPFAPRKYGKTLLSRSERRHLFSVGYLLEISAVIAVWLVALGGGELFSFQQTGTPATPVKKVGRTAQGLYELVTPRLTLVSDIPFDDELKSWPAMIEQSMEQWQIYHEVDASRMDGWHIQALLIGDRTRLTEFGLLDGVPDFDEGYQYGDKIYLREQPTVYYRRHLFLHEATHWVMWKLYGGAGPPWFMEGMADMHGTHSLNNRVLKLGVIPGSSEQVARWGRLRMIHETLNRGVAPSMTEILAYGNAREDHEIRYSWSWAATVFFTNHPKYGPILKELYGKGIDYSDSLSRSFRARLEPDWDRVQADWTGFISDLEFGYDLDRSRVVQSNRPTKQLKTSESDRFTLATDHGWQSTGILVEADSEVRISCSGDFQIKQSVNPKGSDWRIGPSGVTYQFYRGNPLGCVIASVFSSGEPEDTKCWSTIRIGAQGMLVPKKSGELFLKVNESSDGLWDNAGSVFSEISVTDKSVR